MLDQDPSPDRLPLDGEPRTAEVVRRAHQRYKRCTKVENTARTRWLNDYKFANGDSYNNYQWPDSIYQSRGDRPSLTVNETRQHNLHITNEAKQNKAEVRYRPVGDGATAESAKVFEGVYRHIANISNAQLAQGMAIGFQVMGGLGYTHITHDYVDQKSFDQEIYIEAIDDPLTVYLDPDANRLDGSGARFGFIFADRPREEMELKYPELKDHLAPTNAIDGDDSGWLREDHIREARYYEVEEEKDELLGNDAGITILKSMTTPALVKAWEAEAKEAGSTLRRRPVVTKRVKCYTIAGDIVVDETDLPGTSVPIIPWVGEVTVIDSELDRKGHTRAMVGPQQMLNYNWSASVEFGALQSKAPWIAAAKAIEGYETYYRTANTVPHSVLMWNHLDDEGNPIPEPKRSDPPQAAPAFLEGVKLASQFMMTASGQMEAEMGKQGNERSGKAITERQRQADRATYHFVDNQALSIRRQGQIILEWIPEIYDTKRVIKIIGESGDETHVQVDPTAEAAHAKAVDGAAAIFNPGVGRYEVVSDVGPDYATQRQEAFTAIVEILTQAPQLIEKIGDLLFKVADFPLADEIAERLKPGLPEAAQKAIAGLQEQLRAGNKLLGETMQALSEERLKTKDKAGDVDVKVYEAETRRLSALKDALPMDPEALRLIIHESIREAMQDRLGAVTRSDAPDLGVAAVGGDPTGGDATGSMPLRVPNVGLEAATPGGM